MAIQCAVCGVRNHLSGHTHDNTYYCRKCFNKTFVSCTDCSKTVERDSCISAPNNKMVCESCQDDYFCCEKCKDYYLNDNAHCVNDNYYCDDCFSENYNTCSRCEEIVHVDDCAFYDGDPYCEDCFDENYRVCANCGDANHLHDLNVDDYCPNCRDPDENEYIDLYGYSKNPRILAYEACPDSWSMHKESWENTLYMGFELEMEFNNFSDIYPIINKHLEHKYIFKHDGSIDGGGELVVTPHTLKAYRKIKFGEMLNDLKTYATSYDNNHCGLHIHVNRDSFHNNDLDKLRAFFSQNCEQLLKFSQRSKGRMQEWARFGRKWNAGWDQGKYSAIHITRNTYEFRIFRGTLDYTRFRASLEFVDALCTYVKTVGLTHCTSQNSWGCFRDYVRKNQYRFLIKQFEKDDNKELKRKGITPHKDMINRASVLRNNARSRDEIDRLISAFVQSGRGHWENDTFLFQGYILNPNLLQNDHEYSYELLQRTWTDLERR